MDPAPGAPSMGRGRGRGRPPAQATAPAPPVQERPLTPEEDESRVASMKELQRRYGIGSPEKEAGTFAEGVLQQPMKQMAITPDTSRGRSRGRGFTRPQVDTISGSVGRGIEISMEVGGGEQRSPPDERYVSPVAPQQGAEEVVLKSPPAGPQQTKAEGSPTSVIQDAGSVVGAQGGERNQPEVMTEAAGSASLGSTSQTKSRKREVELPVISRIGSKGELIMLGTNYLRLMLDEGRPGVVEYHVSFTYPIESVGVRRKVLKQFEEKLGTARSFDGMVLFLPYILPDDVTVLHGVHPIDPTIEVGVHITYVKVRLMKDSIIFFNILLKRIMMELGYIELRREFYDLNLVEVLNQHKLEIWPGTNPSAENQEDGLMICVDTCSRVLRTDTVYQYYLMLKNDPKLREKFTEYIVNKIVLTRYNNKCYKIDDVAWNLTPESEFEYKTGKITFAEYLKMQYNITASDMMQPMLISKLKPRKNEKFKGVEEQRMAALVPEFCFVTGLEESQRANFTVMSDLAKSTRLTPPQRMQNLEKFVRRLLGSERVRQILGEWGLSIHKDIIHVHGRRTDGPTLLFNQTLKTDKTGPDFSREAGKAVYEPIEVKKYVVLCSQRDADKAKRFMDTYKQVCGPLGIKMLQLGEVIPLRGVQPHDFRNALAQHCDPNKIHFVVIIMPFQRDDVYSAIKRFCVADTPIPSQCIVGKTLGNEKRLRSIVLKIALQINCKLGGALWALRMPLKEEVMFVGIDAAHDPLKKDPSVVCLIATMNNQCTKYYSRSTTSKIHQELVDSLRVMMLDALKQYKKINNKDPDRIVVFRDGGSMGALDQIETTEMNQMKRAVQECEKPVENFTFTVVSKRIPQRFFLKGKNGQYQNPEPGTIIDNTVTTRYLYDFYIVSQQVRQGTVNPTHFIVVDTDDRIKPDLIQKFAYVTSFMYYNWSGTVRVPAMVQYAHKLAALLSRHVRLPPHKAICNTLYYL